MEGGEIMKSGGCSKPKTGAKKPCGGKGCGGKKPVTVTFMGNV